MAFNRIAFVLALFAGLCVVDCRGEEPAWILDAMWSGRDQLISGFVTGTGEITKTSRVEPIHFVLAVDRATSCVRFDDLASSSPSKVIRTRDATVLYIDGTGVVERRSPDYKIGLEGVDAIDVRMCGVASIATLLHRYPYSDLKKFLKPSSVVSCDKRDDGIWRIVWLFKEKQSESRRTMLIDAERNFVPVSHEVQERYDLAEGGMSEFATTLEEKVTWKKFKDEVWLPTKMESSGKHQNAVLKLNWKHVNDELPEELFTLQDFGAPAGVIVSEFRNGAPVVEKILGYEDATVVVNVSGWRLSRVFAGLSILLLVAAVWLTRRR